MRNFQPMNIHPGGGSWFMDRRYVRSKNRRFKNDPYRTVIFTEKCTLTGHFFEYCIPLHCNWLQDFFALLPILLFFILELRNLHPYSAFSKKYTLTVHFGCLEKHTLRVRTYPSVILPGCPPRERNTFFCDLFTVIRKFFIKWLNKWTIYIII